MYRVTLGQVVNSIKKKIQTSSGRGTYYSLLQALCGRMGKNHHICGRVVVDRNFMWVHPFTNDVSISAIDNAVVQIRHYSSVVSDKLIRRLL